jgi:hypothetical protein
MLNPFESECFVYKFILSLCMASYHFHWQLFILSVGSWSNSNLLYSLAYLMLCYRFYRSECSQPREGENAFWIVMNMIRLVEQLDLEETQLKY